MASIAKKYNDVSLPQNQTGLYLLSKLKIKQGMDILDLGCGTGYLSRKLAEQVGPTGRVIGVDPDRERIKVAQEVNGGVDNLLFEDGSTEKFTPGPYDIVFSHAVLNWVLDKEIAFKNVHKALKPGGFFALCVGLSHNKLFDQWMDLLDAKAKEEVYSMFHYKPKEHYLDLGKLYGFSVVSMECYPVVFKFDNIDAALDWWYAVTHGKFDPKLVDIAKHQELKQTYGDGSIEFAVVEADFIVFKKS